MSAIGNFAFQSGLCSIAQTPHFSHVGLRRSDSDWPSRLEAATRLPYPTSNPTTTTTTTTTTILTKHHHHPHPPSRLSIISNFPHLHPPPSLISVFFSPPFLPPPLTALPLLWSPFRRLGELGDTLASWRFVLPKNLLRLSFYQGSSRSF